MNIEVPHIALIYFSRNTDAESHAKHWFGNKRAKNRAIASSLQLQTSRIVQEAGFPVFHYHEGNQRGDTFGQRLAHAYEEVFALGYQAVIAVGNDSPELGQTDWETTAQKLSAGICVLGPSLRGGAYFIGITREAFHKNVFQNLPWKTNRLFEALRQFCSYKNQAAHLIAPLRDINSLYDLRAIVKSAFITQGFKRQLLFLLAEYKKYIAEAPVNILSTFSPEIGPSRAPPILPVILH
ncbi:MAG: DUF2064 domain-containing protein [Bacteroidia bacterium]